jgi:chemotaxis protein MotA
MSELDSYRPLRPTSAFQPRPGSWRVSFDDAPRIDRSVIIGLCASCALVLFGAIAGGSILKFLSPTGFVLVIGGTIASTLVQFSIRDIRSALTAARGALFMRDETTSDRIRYLVQISRRIKDEGVLMLEQEAAATPDPFLRLGLEVTVDGQKPDDVRRILGNEMRTAHEQSAKSVHIWETMGNFAPAMGLIGTLLGLIQMLGALQDAATVGPAMSLALVATLYGAIAANLIFFPIAGKLRLEASEKAQIKEVTLEALLSLAASESPVMLEQRLQSFSSLSANG